MISTEYKISSIINNSLMNKFEKLALITDILDVALGFANQESSPGILKLIEENKDKMNIYQKIIITLRDPNLSNQRKQQHIVNDISNASNFAPEEIRDILNEYIYCVTNNFINQQNQAQQYINV